MMLRADMLTSPASMHWKYRSANLASIGEFHLGETGFSPQFGSSSPKQWEHVRRMVAIITARCAKKRGLVALGKRSLPYAEILLVS